jgi:D-alanyl-D-alanine carboxypeptidase/D-alanyl-D-alanine-endopeptidase (penicillin-binding protein 4)
MQEPDLRGHVRAKTGTLNHVRALSGYLTTAAGETLAFSMVANHFTAPSAEVDAIMERALRRLRDRGQVLLSDLAFGRPDH